MKVGLLTARHLGWSVAEYIAQQNDGSTIVAHHHVSQGWWGEAGITCQDDVFAQTPDIVISVLTDHIFTAAEIAATPKGIWNLHPAPLPTYRGCNSYSHAIINDDTTYGVTLHRVDEGIDTGPILDSRTLPIHENETARQLHDRAQPIALELFIANWPKLRRDMRPFPRVQTGPATYYPRCSLEPYRNLAHHPPQHRDRIRRALTFPPFPAPLEA